MLDLLWHIQNDTNLVFVWQLSFWQDQGPAILGYNLWLILIPRWTVLDRSHRLPVKPWNKEFRIISWFCRNYGQNSKEVHKEFRLEKVKKTNERPLFYFLFGLEGSDGSSICVFQLFGRNSWRLPFGKTAGFSYDY